MTPTYQTAEEIKDLNNQQIFSLEKDLARGYFNLNGIGDLFPGSIMVHDMKALQVSYMNNWGCAALNHSMEEINAMGAAYFDKFLVAEETQRIIPEITAYFENKNNAAPYSFFQRVRSGPKMELNWHYTSCKFLRDETGAQSAQLILVSNPVAGMGIMVNKVTKLLDENVYVAKNYKKFMRLTKREREIITLLQRGKQPKIYPIYYSFPAIPLAHIVKT
jgi:hypothetical protein